MTGVAALHAVVLMNLAATRGLDPGKARVLDMKLGEALYSHDSPTLKQQSLL